MNQQLTQVYEEDISDRRNAVPSEQLDRNDRRRINAVKNIIIRNQDLDAQDYHHASLIFQHGEKSSDFKRAHELALKAVSLGDDSAKWLAAASLDRYLLMVGQAQRYGTQFKLNSLGEWEMAMPIDPSVTDEERAKWNVPPLKDALMVYKNKYGL